MRALCGALQTNNGHTARMVVIHWKSPANFVAAGVRRSAVPHDGLPSPMRHNAMPSRKVKPTSSP